MVWETKKKVKKEEKKEVVKNCECCGTEIELVFGGTHYCNSCAVHHHRLREELYSLRAKVKRFEQGSHYGKEVSFRNNPK